MRSWSKPKVGFLSLFLPIALLICAGAYWIGHSEIARRSETLGSGERLDVGLSSGAASTSLASVITDLGYLSRLGSLAAAVEGPTARNIRALEQELALFSSSKGTYDQLRWIDETGMERVRVDAVQGKTVIVKRADLQMKADRYYFDEAIRLREGGIYISPLDLNMERDRIEIPLKPMIRLATPVFNRRGGRRGVFIINFLGGVLLDAFEKASGGRHGQIRLANREGYWLKSPDPNEEWGFMFQRASQRLPAQFPAVWERVIREDRGQALFPDGLWTWQAIHPVAAPRGSAVSRDYVWFAVSWVPRQALLAMHTSVWRYTLGVASLMLAVLGLGSWKLARAWENLSLAESEVRQLAAGLESQVENRTRDLHGKIQELDAENRERLRVERALRAREAALELAMQRLSLATTSAGLGVWDWDLRTGSLFWDDRMMQLYGVTREPFAPTLDFWREAIHPEDRERAMAESQAALGESRPYCSEFRLLRKDGSISWIKANGLVLRDESGQPEKMIGLNQDITEGRNAQMEILNLTVELEQRVTDRTARLQEANDELEAFSYSVSHDLRSPLQAISGYTGVLMDEFQEFPASDGRKYLYKIYDSARRMGQIIEDLLNLSHINRAEINLANTDLSVLCLEVLAHLSQNHPERQVAASVMERMQVSADPRLMLEVLENLLGNAWKFTAKEPHARIEAGELMLAEHGRTFFIRDNGAGFDMADAGKLFKAFERLHPRNEFDGTGIGLAIVQRIIHRHGGRIWAEGAPGQGSTFFFTLRGPEGTLA